MLGRVADVLVCWCALGVWVMCPACKQSQVRREVLLEDGTVVARGTNIFAAPRTGQQTWNETLVPGQHGGSTTWPLTVVFAKVPQGSV